MLKLKKYPDIYIFEFILNMWNSLIKQYWEEQTRNTHTFCVYYVFTSKFYRIFNKFEINNDNYIQLQCFRISKMYKRMVNKSEHSKF